MSDPSRDRSETDPVSRGLFALWFGVQRDVDRRAYVGSAVLLVALRYLFERAIIQSATGRVLSPFEALLPRWSAHEALLQGAPAIAGWLLAALLLPMVWIALSLSVRRAGNAGLSPWWGLLVLVPMLNVLAILALALLPTRPRPAAAPDGPPPDAPPVAPAGTRMASGQRARLLGLLTGLGVGFAVATFAIFALQSYSLVVFVGLPLVMGAVAVCAAGRGRLTTPAAAGQGALVVLLGAGCMLLFGLEGALCLAMALPLVLTMGLIGGAIGRHCATAAPATGAFAVVLSLPLFAGLEAWGSRQGDDAPPLHEVLTVVEVDAAPCHVWPHVVDMPRLPAPKSWVFDAGVAYPLSMRVVGSGLGALCQCEFTTGIFSGTVTAYETRYRLAFDVDSGSQPPPMVELNPWGAIDAPHLHSALRSRSGEFRLVPLPGQRTRLEGRTWYELDMEPRAYWQLWSDVFIRQFHRRVLDEIKAASEAGR